MSRFVINGHHRDCPIQQDHPLAELFEYIRGHLNSETCLVTSIKVNGQELNEVLEKDFANLALSQFDSIEVFTQHPREVAEATLQDLIGFSEYLAALSCNTAAEFQKGQPALGFPKLMDGVTVFTESVRSVKQILRIGILQPLDIAEADLLSILKDILAAHQHGENQYLADLLNEHLPVNLMNWRDEVIPAMIRARDS